MLGESISFPGRVLARVFLHRICKEALCGDHAETPKVDSCHATARAPGLGVAVLLEEKEEP